MPETKPMSGVKIISFVIGGLIALVIGGNLAVNGAVGIARILNVSERIIGLTIVAFGTSLPELVTCIIAALKKQSDIAIGNIVGSNIFNILFVLGIAGLIRSIPFEPVFLVDAVISLFTVILLWIATVRHGRLSRPMGALFFGFYIVYIIWLILAK